MRKTPYIKFLDVNNVQHALEIDLSKMTVVINGSGATIYTGKSEVWVGDESITVHPDDTLTVIIAVTQYVTENALPDNTKVDTRPSNSAPLMIEPHGLI